MFSYELTGKARENYREYIRKNLGDIAEYLVKQEDMRRLEMISSQKLWTLEGIDIALDCASKRKETEVSAFLMNERSRMLKEEQKVAGETENERCPVKRRKKFQL